VPEVRHETTEMTLSTTLFEQTNDEQILDFEVLEHYIALLIEKKGQR